MRISSRNEGVCTYEPTAQDPDCRRRARHRLLSAHRPDPVQKNGPAHQGQLGRLPVVPRGPRTRPRGPPRGPAAKGGGLVTSSIPVFIGDGEAVFTSDTLRLALGLKKTS